jgi:hypothetical protein
MKNPFDRIIGPNGEWIDGDDSEKPEVVDENGLSEREEFAFRCMNAAVNLYGVVTLTEMTAIYNHYAAGHRSPISDPMDENEFLDIADALLAKELDYTWFSVWLDDKSGIRRVVNCDLTSVDHPQDEEPQPDVAKRMIDKRIAEAIEYFHAVDLKMPEEDAFFCYENPMCDEVTPEAKKFAKFLKKEYHVAQLDAAMAVMGIQAELRVNGDILANALEYVRWECDFSPEDRDGVERLVDAVSPVVSTTRTWDYRGHTAREMSDLGLISRLATEKVPDVFGFEETDNDGCGDDEDDEYYDDETISVGELPPAKYTGPVDFKFVKDPVERDRMLWDYEGVRVVTREFVRYVVIPESTKEERLDAAKRLGFPIDEERGCVSDPNLDMVAGDFATMMDDQHGEPAIKRILKRKDKLENDYDRAAAEYYENYRYTWLEVLAVKSGVGMKCRDLLTGEELFLMETSFSKGDVKGMTVCAGIAPMGSVYLSLGVIHPSNFENPATILKIVLTHLGLQTELPIKLSFADQARFAAETIRRINANGRFNAIAYGCADN